MNQKFWIAGSIGTAIPIANAKDRKIGDCIANWYYGDKEAERNTLILAAMKKYKDSKPSTVMIALLEHACGNFRKG